MAIDQAIRTGITPLPAPLPTISGFSTLKWAASGNNENEITKADDGQDCLSCWPNPGEDVEFEGLVESGATLPHQGEILTVTGAEAASYEVISETRTYKGAKGMIAAFTLRHKASMNYASTTATTVVPKT